MKYLCRKKKLTFEKVLMQDKYEHYFYNAMLPTPLYVWMVLVIFLSIGVIRLNLGVVLKSLTRRNPKLTSIKGKVSSSILSLIYLCVYLPVYAHPDCTLYCKSFNRKCKINAIKNKHKRSPLLTLSCRDKVATPDRII